METSQSTQNYKDSLKATSLFGGVQIYVILISIVRSKVIALLLGPAGMGIAGLFTATTGLITSFTNLGLSTSAVKDIAEANATGDKYMVSRLITVFRKLVWFTGILGLLVCLFMAPYWSKLTFGSWEYTLSFCILSVTLLFTQLSSGQLTLLQGLRRYRLMAKATLLGNTLGLIISVPLYFFFRINAIVPVIILASFTTLLVSWFYSRRVRTEPVDLSVRDVFSEGKSMIKMGIFLTVQHIFSILSAYLIRIYINHIGGLNEVGLYNAGFAIANTYVGLVFTAMGTEYYPRLAGISKQMEKFRLAINQQIEVCLLLLSPIICLFIIFVDIAIRLLYSESFLGIDSMLYWAILGMFFKAPAWAIAFSFIAKRDTKVMLQNELLATFYIAVLNILFYTWWGLEGLGISFFLGYMIYFFQVWYVCRKVYDFKLDRSFRKYFFIHFLISAGAVCLVIFTPVLFRYIIGSLLFLLALFLSYKTLDQKIGIREIIKNKFRLK